MNCLSRAVPRMVQSHSNNLQSSLDHVIHAPSFFHQNWICNIISWDFKDLVFYFWWNLATAFSKNILVTKSAYLPWDAIHNGQAWMETFKIYLFTPCKGFLFSASLKSMASTLICFQSKVLLKSFQPRYIWKVIVYQNSAQLIQKQRLSSRYIGNTL